MSRVFVTIFATFLCCLSNAQVTVVRAGRLIDPDSASVLIDQEILIVESKVAAVGKQLRVPENAKWIDLSDKTVLPGLIDCHTHLVDGATAMNFDPFNVLKKTAAQIVLGAGVFTHGSSPIATEFTLEELRAAVEEAHAFGLRVEAHAHSAQGIKNAIRAGVASVEHATLIDDE